LRPKTIFINVDSRLVYEEVSLQVAVIGGGGRCSNEVCTIARQLGKRLAENGRIVVCGGLGGVMEAVCHGASELMVWI